MWRAFSPEFRCLRCTANPPLAQWNASSPPLARARLNLRRRPKQYILDNSQSSYAHLLAASSLVKLVSEQAITSQLRLDIRNYVLGFLASKGPTLQTFVSTWLVQLVGRITKLGWAESEDYRNIVSEASKFLAAGSLDHFFLGLKILNQLVAELNQPNPGRSLTQHRKTAVSFRDLALSEIFKIALTSLRQLMEQGGEDRVRDQALALALKCLSYDFVGTSLDESSEDLGTIQVPSSWRPLLEESSTMKLFFDYYAATRPRLSTQALECLVRLASVRRSLFSSEAERCKFLAQLMNGTREILRTQSGLEDHDNYHEYCRLLGRLKTNYQLSELVKVDHYSEWIQLVADFTQQSLINWQWAAGSVYYLLGLWSRLISSMPYLKGDSPSLLDNYVPKITTAYVTSRLDSVAAVLASQQSGGGGIEDPLENEEQLQEQLDAIPYLARFDYAKTSEYLCTIIDPLMAAYASAGETGQVPAGTTLAVLEGQLTWLVYIVGAIVRGRLGTSSAESQEVIDGELASRVFQLVKCVDAGYHCRPERYGEVSKQRLDQAILHFFQSFRKVYIGEQAMHSSKVYARLNERVLLADHLVVLNVMVSKVATNLKCFVRCDGVIQATLGLFQDLATGYMSGKLMLKLEAINFILNNHTAEQFPFLNEQSNMRNRTTFYLTLGRLLFMEDSPARFRTFMAPLNTSFQQLVAADPTAFQSAGAKATLIGLLRDLRGLATAANSRKTYGMLFEWMYPRHMPVLLRALETYADQPEVTTPVLKFLSEFVLNKTQRLTFDSSSPNGILLFREVSKLLLAYGNRALQLQPADPYAGKYKGVWVALQMLTRALGGGYTNFGVFELYGDPALRDALGMALKLALTIPLNDIVAFRKVAKAYYALLEQMCHSHTAFVIGQDSTTFARIVESLEVGLKSLDVSISSQCASAVDSLAAFHFNKNLAPRDPDEAPHPMAAAMAQHVAARPGMFPDILKLLFEIVLFEDCANQWSLSRPMLSLILVNESVFGELKLQIAASQPQERQARVDGCFTKLMQDVNRSLDSKNRDRFTQALTVFRHEFRQRT